MSSAEPAPSPYEICAERFRAYTALLPPLLRRAGAMEHTVGAAHLAELATIDQDLKAAGALIRDAFSHVREALRTHADMRAAGQPEGEVHYSELKEVLARLQPVNDGMASLRLARDRLDALEARSGAPAGYDPAHQP